MRNIVHKYLFVGLIVCLNISLPAQILTESNLPILVITTESGEEIPDEPKLAAQLGIINNGAGQMNNLSDAYTDYDGLIGIELRGQTSQFFPKKPYGFETRLPDGSNNNVSLLGMPAENDWVLHNPYSDKTLLRNAMSYTLAGQIMDYAPRPNMVEVILNDEYRGVYLLTEKIKRDAGRVDIATLTSEDNEGDEVTGGYIVKLDKYNEGDWGVFSNYPPPMASDEQFIGFLYHYPKVDQITTAQSNYLENFLHGFEDALQGENFADPEEGYRAYIDETTFIDYLIINEITRNVDGYRLSTYLYKDKDSNDPLMKIGPVWDYNLALGNADYCQGGEVTGWAYDFNAQCSEDFWLVPFWWQRLLEDEVFVGDLHTRWNDLRGSTFSDDRLNFICDSLTELTAAAAARNYQKYPESLGQYVWPNNFVGETWQEEVDYMCGWLNDRVEWLDEAFQELLNPTFNPADTFEPRVIPNISDSDFTFEYYVPESTNVLINIYDVKGRLVETLSQDVTRNGHNQLTYAAQNLQKGMYFYSIESSEDEEIYSGKLVKL